MIRRHELTGEQWSRTERLLRMWTRRVVGDKAHSSGQARRYWRRRGIGAVIPTKAKERRRGARFDRAAYWERNQVNRTG